MIKKKKATAATRRKPFKDWLRPGGELQPWIDVFCAIDERGDKEPLLALLRSKETASFPFAARWHLADLLERFNLAKSKKSRRVPSYNRGDEEKFYLAGEESISVAKAAGISGTELDELIEITARVRGLDEERFRAHLTGKLGYTRKLRKRRPPE